MSKSEDRLKKQPQENQKIYYDWIDELKRLERKGLDQYQSAVSEFLEYNGSILVLDVKFETIEKFLNDRPIKLNRKHTKLRYLKNFLEFVSRKYKPRWNFELNYLKVLLSSNAEVKANTVSAKALSAKQLIKLYNFLNENLKDKKWLEVYTIFRLMYNYDLNKYDIAKIDSSTYDIQTGIFQKSRNSTAIVFDEEIVNIFENQGLEFLPHNGEVVYLRLMEIEKILGENINQEIIKITKKQLRIRCPQCGLLIENILSQFGYVKIDILNLGTLIVCKKCLENEL
jgi:hypothetical protein